MTQSSVIFAGLPEVRQLTKAATPMRVARIAGFLCALFAACGPLHALGYADAVYWTVLAGLALAAVAVPLGLLGLRHHPPGTDV